MDEINYTSNCFFSVDFHIKLISYNLVIIYGVQIINSNQTFLFRGQVFLHVTPSPITKQDLPVRPLLLLLIEKHALLS